MQPEASKQGISGHSKVRQSKTKQSRAKHGKAKQSRAEPSQAKQSKARQCTQRKAKQSQAKQSKARKQTRKEASRKESTRARKRAIKKAVYSSRQPNKQATKQAFKILWARPIFPPAPRIACKHGYQSRALLFLLRLSLKKCCVMNWFRKTKNIRHRGGASHDISRKTWKITPKGNYF